MNPIFSEKNLRNTKNKINDINNYYIMKYILIDIGRHSGRPSSFRIFFCKYKIIY